MPESLSLQQARKLALNCQHIGYRTFNGSVDGALRAIEQLGYLQIDTLAVVERAHHHTLWNRLKTYQPDFLDQLQERGKIFEYWAHALAYLPMRDFRFSLPMKARIAAGDTHWQKKEKKQCNYVLQRIREEGPLAARDFADKRSSNAMWARSPSKRALEQLFMEGELMIPRRVNFQKVYDLRERVLPAEVNTQMPSPQELARHLIINYLRSHGFGTAKEIAYLRKGLGPVIKREIQHLCEEGLITPVTIDQTLYYSTDALLNRAGKLTRAKSTWICSPFDNVVIQRQRLKKLFQFDYQIECYVPEAKRQYGYFCLPLLWGDTFIGRMDAKAERKTGTLNITHLHLEKSSKFDAVAEDLGGELQRFANFNRCRAIAIDKISGCSQKQCRQIKNQLQHQLKTAP